MFNRLQVDINKNKQSVRKKQTVSEKETNCQPVSVVLYYTYVVQLLVCYIILHICCTTSCVLYYITHMLYNFLCVVLYYTYVVQLLVCCIILHICCTTSCVLYYITHMLYNFLCVVLYYTYVVQLIVCLFDWYKTI